MTETEANVALVQAYFATIEHGVDAKEIAAFYAPNVVQTEFPNQFEPNGARRDLKGLQEAARRFDRAGLADALRRLSQTDRMLKSSALPPRLVLESLTISLCARGRKRQLAEPTSRRLSRDL